MCYSRFQLSVSFCARVIYFIISIDFFTHITSLFDKSSCFFTTCAMANSINGCLYFSDYYINCFSRFVSNSAWINFG